jgi:DNA-binding cell septation regulator SpoVG
VERQTVSPRVTEVRFAPADDEHREEGLLGWTSFVIDGGLKVEGVAVRRTAEGHLALAYPYRDDAHGLRRRFLRPINDQTRRALQAQVLAQLDLDRELAQ